MSTATDRYTVISSDTHAGGRMAMYEEYLDAKWADEFAEWRGAYKNPFRDLQDNTKDRNWDDERRVSEMHEDGVVAEVVFPNTVPPFFPTGQLISYPPTEARDLERRQAGLDAHNRWLKDWCSVYPDQRVGLTQIFLNDLDQAIETVKWSAENGFKSFMLPSVPPDLGIPPLYHPDYDRFWAVCQDLDIVITQHGGNGGPDYGDAPSAKLMYLMEVGFFANRSLSHMIMSGVFERFPKLKFVMTEQGVAWAVEVLRRMDAYHGQMVSGRVGELGFPAEIVLPKKPSEYFNTNVWIGASFPSPNECKAIQQVGVDRVMWGTDYPHHEGTYPFSREAIRKGMHDWSEEDMRKVLSLNAAEVYGFDLDALAPLAAEHGPTVEELRVPLESTPKGATSPAFFKP